MAGFANDDVIVQRDAERPGDVVDVLGHAHIGGRGRRVTRGVIVHQDDGGSGEFERAADHLARIDGGVIDGAGLLHLIGDQPVFLVQKQNAELLDALIGHLAVAVLDQLRPGRQYGLGGVDPVATEAGGNRLDHLEMGNGGGAQPLDSGQTRLAGGEDAGKRTEFAQQRLGQRLGVAPGNGQLQGQFEQFVIFERVTPHLEEAFAHPLAMPGMVVDARIGRWKAGLGEFVGPVAHQAARTASGLNNPPGDRVKISWPVSVMPMECSHCADRVRSRVTAVQPSERIFTSGRPRLIIGSMVKIMPGLSGTPVPGLPKWRILGSSWNSWPRPWPTKSRTTLMRSASARVWMAWPISPVVLPGMAAARPASRLA